MAVVTAPAFWGGATHSVQECLGVTEPARFAWRLTLLMPWETDRVSEIGPGRLAAVHLEWFPTAADGDHEFEFTSESVRSRRTAMRQHRHHQGVSDCQRMLAR